MKSLSVVSLALLLLISCDRGRSDAVTGARDAGSQLVIETRELWARHRTDATREIPVAEYPATIRQLQPKRVWAAPQGLYVETYSFFVESAGIFIRHDPAYDPPPNGDPGFQPVTHDVYWFYAPG